MRRTTDAERDAAYDYVMEQRRKAEERDSKGLCHQCGSEPKNPAIGVPLCLECWEDTEFGCMKDGCPNTAVGEFRQGRFCEVHLTDVIHSAYHEWEQLKSKVEETEREFEDRVADVGFDPRDNPKRPSEYTEEEQDLEDKLTELGMMKREEGWLKGDLKRTMECVDEPFHENYPVGI